MERISLQWEGPYLFANILSESSLRQKYMCPGVYLWVEKHKGVKSIHYVGRATGNPTLWQRHFQHYKNQIGGLYDIPGDVRSGGTGWKPEPSDEAIATLLDKQKFVQLISESFDYVKRFQVYFARLDSSLVREVERALLYDLKPKSTSYGTRNRPYVDLHIVHYGASWRDAEGNFESLCFPQKIRLKQHIARGQYTSENIEVFDLVELKEELSTRGSRTIRLETNTFFDDDVRAKKTVRLEDFSQQDFMWAAEKVDYEIRHLCIN